ncbi:MAG: TolC family protein [Puniceicoccales bacterium]|nr:TolC family protein [Puniceicoccales bacterium]
MQSGGKLRIFRGEFFVFWAAGLLGVGGCRSFEEEVVKNEQRALHFSGTVNGVPPAATPLAPAGEIFFTCDHDLDLYELLDLAFDRNPSTRVAWHQITSALAQKTKADSAFYPHVAASLNAGRSEQLGGKGPDGKHLTTSIASTVYPQVEISYSLFKFGAHRESSAAALGALKAANFQFNHALQQVAYRVNLAYFGLNAAIAIVRASEQNLEDAKVALDAAKNRHQSGLASKQDSLKAQAAYSAAAFELEHSRSAVESARARLAQAIGIRVSDQLRVVADGGEEIPDLGSVERLIGEALELRQDMWAKREALEAKRHNLNARQCDRYPEVVAGLRASRKKVQHVPGMYNNFEAYVGLKWDIFDGHLKMAEQLMAHEDMKIAGQQLKAQAVDIASEVWEYFYALKSAVQKLGSAEEAERSALEAFRYTREAYGSGLSSFTDLSTSQSALSNARKQLIFAKNDLSVSRVNLAYCAGKILEQ